MNSFEKKCLYCITYNTIINNNTSTKILNKSTKFIPYQDIQCNALQ